MQTLIPPFRRIPRALFTVLAFIIYTVAGVAGRQHFSVFLKNFLAVVGVRSHCYLRPFFHLVKVGYWVSFWIVILLEEHYIFRRKGGVLGGYDLDGYDTPRLSVNLLSKMSLLPLNFSHAGCQSGSRPCMFCQRSA
jgi:purine-cytosine permease-like protein